MSTGAYTWKGITYESRLAAMQAIVVAAARKAGIAPELALAVCETESDFDPEAVSPEGAVGLFQLEPATALEFGVSSPATLKDPQENSEAGCAYLAKLLTDWDGNVLKALASYNWGPGNVQRAVNRQTAGGVMAWLADLPTETANYLQRVTSRMYARLIPPKAISA